VEAVAVVPVGFVSDHMEVVHDLDVAAAGTAAALGLAFARAATPGVALAPMIEELVRAHLAGAAPEPCPAGCCR
jgi:ferrochelatase